jgi:ribosome-associated protein
MDTEQLKDLILFELEERKAENIKIFDTRDSGVAQYMVIASGRSSRNVFSIADIVSANVKNKTGFKVALDGLRNSTWAVFETGGIIVHIFHPETRDYYNIEEIFESSNHRAA